MAEDLFRSKNAVVYDLLKEKIIRGDLAPGQALKIEALAAQVGVSAIPVREALRHLEANGFVVIEPYVGVTVTPLEAASIREVFSTLEALEIISGRRLCERVTHEDLALLEDEVSAMAHLTGDAEAWSARNKKLHRTICSMAGMVLVEKMLSVALDHWDRLRRCYLEDVFARRVGLRQNEHEQILDALHQRNPDALETVVRAHNRAALKAYSAHLQQAGLLENEA